MSDEPTGAASASGLLPHDPALLDLARRHAAGWLEALPERPIPPRATADEIADALGRELPERGEPAAEVIERLVDRIEPGLMAMGSPRFFGWVIGGAQPVALAADWLVSAWDQNNGLRNVTPGTAAVEEVAATWILDLLGLPAESEVGFATGATTAQFACLAAARDEVLRRAGWDVARDGLSGGPRVRFVVGSERHVTIDLAGRYLGLGVPVAAASDEQGRIRPDALRELLAAGEGPVVVCLQAGNVHSGGFDPFAEAIAIAHRHGAWVHVDGAFGLWAAASPHHRHLLEGHDAADSWATDAHKTLNVPYDCGLAIVRDRVALKAAMGMHGDYLIHDEAGEPLDKVPEVSRRGRAFPVWAVLKALGRDGVAALVDGLCRHATTFADGLAELPEAQVCNDVVFTQVCASFGDDRRTKAVVDAMLADGTAWMTGSLWHGRAVLRISVSNWSTTDDDVRRSLDALAKAVATTGAGREAE